MKIDIEQYKTHDISLSRSYHALNALDKMSKTSCYCYMAMPVESLRVEGVYESRSRLRNALNLPRFQSW